MTAVHQQYLNALSPTRADLPGAGVDWLDRARRDAAERLAEAGFPTQRQEGWRYTSLRFLEKQLFVPAPKPRDEVDVAAVAELDSLQLVIVDGHYRGVSGTGADVPEGVRIGSLAETLAAEPDRLQACFGTDWIGPRHGFTELNAAFAGDGAVIELAAGNRLERPIEVLYLATGTDERPLLNQPRTLVIAHEGSRASVVERFTRVSDNRYLTNSVTGVHLGANAEIEHYRLQEEGLGAYHIGGTFFRQGRGSRVQSHALSLGATLARHDVIVRLEGEEAECVLNGLYVGTGHQHVDNHTRIEHAVPRARSREFYKGILDGRARAVFQGYVVVRPDAQKSDAEQRNQNLLLSRGAEVDTKPQLEIYADDVKCAHGATVGQLDSDALFYLRARGLPEVEARDLLTFAFANDVLSRVQLAPLRNHVEKSLSQRLGHGRGSGEPS